MPRTERPAPPAPQRAMFVIITIGSLIFATLGCGRSDKQPQEEMEEVGFESGPVEDAVVWDEAGVEKIESLVLEPLRIEDFDFEVESVPVVSESRHADIESAFLLEEPWAVRGHLPDRETRVFELRTEGEAQLWHIEAEGENLSSLRYLDAGGSSQLSRNADRTTGTAVMTNLFLPPGGHWFAIRAINDSTDYTFRCVPLGPPDPHAEREPNDDVTRAQRMTFGFPRTGLLYEPGDVDVYRFSLAATEHLVLKIEPPADLSIRMDLSETYGPNNRHRIVTGRSLAEGDALEYRALLPAGDYLVELQGDGRNTVSESPYVISLERRNPFDLPADLEPNDTSLQARPLPPGHILSGDVGRFSGRDWFQIPERDVETQLTIEVIEEPERFGASLYESGSTRDSRLLQRDRETGLFHAVLDSETSYQLQLTGRGAYRLRFSFDPGPAPQAELAPLPVDISFGASPKVIAAYWPYGQHIDVPVLVRNRGEASVDIRFDAVSSNEDWIPELSSSSIDLGPGKTSTVPMVVRIAPDMRGGEPVRITVRAQNKEGLFVTSAHRLVAQCAAEPQNSEPVWKLPAELLGGLNVAWTALGAEPVGEKRDRDRERVLYDGFTPIDSGWHRRNLKPPVELTVRLAGDRPVRIAGTALLPLSSGVQPDRQLKSFDVLVSDDGKTFRDVFSGELSRRPVEQGFVFDEPVEARFARLRMRANHLGEDDNFGLGQWKVIAVPGESLTPGRAFNIAAADLGGHVVCADPIPGSYRTLAAMLDEDTGDSNVRVEESQPMRWVVSFNQQRAARIVEMQWVDTPGRAFGNRLENVAVAVSMDSPLGPWKELGLWELKRTPEGVDPFVLPEPVWARYVLFSSTDPEERANWQYPKTLRILEQLPDDVYRSILAEWGHYSREAAYEYLEPQEPMAFVAPSGDHRTRAQARRLPAGETYSGAVLVGEAEDWHRIDIPSGANLLTVRMMGEPNVRTEAELENREGNAVAIEKEEISPREVAIRAEVESGETYFLRVFEPPRSFIFAWDNSGSMGPYKAVVYQALQQFVQDVHPGREYANFVPFQDGKVRLLHPEWSDQSYLLQATLSNYDRRDSSSNAEPNLLAATLALADRPGVKAIMVLTDAQTYGFRSAGDLWRVMADVRPQIFSVEMHSGSGPAYHQKLMQSWASVNAGHYSLFGTQADVDTAFDRAACYLRRPARYAVTAVTSYEEPPEPEMYDILMDKGRVVTHGILFDIDSHTLRAESYPVLRQIGEMLQKHSALRLMIEGHTDNTGSASWNQALSERRAASVRTYLVERYGIEEARLESVGYGEDRPADTNETAEGRQNNRRVELVRLE